VLCDTQKIGKPSGFLDTLNEMLDTKLIFRQIPAAVYYDRLRFALLTAYTGLYHGDPSM
jgi:hypothetical protein